MLWQQLRYILTHLLSLLFCGCRLVGNFCGNRKVAVVSKQPLRRRTDRSIDPNRRHLPYIPLNTTLNNNRLALKQNLLIDYVR